MPVMDSLQTGILTSDLRSLPGRRTAHKNRYNYQRGSVGKNGSGSHGSQGSQAWEKPRNHGNNAIVTTGRPEFVQGNENYAGRTGSEDRMIIKQTTTTVQFQER